MTLVSDDQEDISRGLMMGVGTRAKGSWEDGLDSRYTVAE